MRRLILALVIVSLLLLALPVGAVGPTPQGGCPDGWNYTIAYQGGPGPIPDLSKMDANGDGVVCAFTMDSGRRLYAENGRPLP
jgi:hypothetical protein